MNKISNPFDKAAPKREYMSIKEFLEKFSMKRPMNYHRSKARVPNALWFEFYDDEATKRAWEAKDKFCNHLDVVFFDVLDIVELREKENIGLFGAVDIEIMDESLGKIKLSYKNEMAKGYFTFTAKKVGVKIVEVTNNYQDIPKKCNLCCKEILVDNYGNGTCSYCGWLQSQWAVENPDEIDETNLISFNRAKNLFSNGLPIKLTFEEFLYGLETTLHMEFCYKGQVYGTLAGHGNGYEIFTDNIKDGYQSYETLEEFREKAHISGRLLKSIWKEIEKPRHMTR